MERKKKKKTPISIPVAIPFLGKKEIKDVDKKERGSFRFCVVTGFSDTAFPCQMKKIKATRFIFLAGLYIDLKDCLAILTI